MDVIFLLPAPIVPSHFDLIVAAPQGQTRVIVQSHRLRQHLRLHCLQKIGCIGIHRSIEHQILPNHDSQGIASIIKRLARISPTAPYPHHVVPLGTHDIQLSQITRLTQKQSLRIHTRTVAKLPRPNQICTHRKYRNSIYGKRKSSASGIQPHRPNPPISFNSMYLIAAIFILLMRRNFNVIQCRMRILIQLLIQPIRHPMLGIFHSKGKLAIPGLHTKFIRRNDGPVLILIAQSHHIPFNIVVHIRQIARGNAHKIGPTSHRIAQIIQLGVTVNIFNRLTRFYPHPRGIFGDVQRLQVIVAPAMNKHPFAQTHQNPAGRNIPTILYDGLAQERTRLGRWLSLFTQSITAKRGDGGFIIGRKHHTRSLAVQGPQLTRRGKMNIHRILAIFVDEPIQINGHFGETAHQRIHFFDQFLVDPNFHVGTFPLLDL